MSRIVVALLSKLPHQWLWRALRVKHRWEGLVHTRPRKLVWTYATGHPLITFEALTESQAVLRVYAKGDGTYHEVRLATGRGLLQNKLTIKSNPLAG